MKNKGKYFIIIILLVISINFNTNEKVVSYSKKYLASNKLMLKNQAGSYLSNNETIKIMANESYKITSELNSSDSNIKIYWISSDENIATVSSDGVITGKNKNGSVSITAVSSDNKLSQSVQVNVIKDMNPTSISLSASNINLSINKTYKLYAAVSPYDSYNSSVTYESSNSSIVKVSEDGVIKAVKSGTATITVRTQNNLTANCTVIVENKASGFWWPISKKYKNKVFVKREYKKNHLGLDITSSSGKKGEIDVIASYDGVVEYAYKDVSPKYDNYYSKFKSASKAVKSKLHDGYGNCVKIKHKYKGQVYYTYYAHLTQDVKVKKGQIVKAGDVIGKMGNSGNSTGTHLHFEIRKGSAVRTYKSANNPLKYVKKNKYPTK